MVLTLILSENAVYGAFPIISVSNLKSTATSTKASDLVLYHPLILSATLTQKALLMLIRSNNCNKK